MNIGAALGKPARDEQSRPTVSIVIPCHNYGRFLADALESALGQTRPPDEVIVVDDGSTDDSLAVARRYQHHPAVQVIRQEQQGAIATYNTGVRASTSSFFLILSADDRLDLRYLERTAPVLDAHPEAGYVYTAYRMFGARHRVRAAPHYNAALLARRPYITATALMRRAAFDEAGGFSPAMEGGHEDWEFFVTLAQHGLHGIALPEVLFHYRKHSAVSRNALTFRRWLGVRARVYRRHRSLYRLPLRPFLALVVLDQQWLRLKAAPRAVLRKLGHEGAPAPDNRRVCLIAPRLSDHQDSFEWSRQALAPHLHLSVVGARQPGHSANSIDPSSGRTRSALPNVAQTSLDAVRQRAAIYHAFEPPGLAAAALAATINRGILLYDPPAHHSNRTSRHLWRIVEWLLRIRVDALTSAESACAAPLQRRFGLPPLIVGPNFAPPHLPAAALATEQQIDAERLLLLYRDLLGAP